MLVKTLGFLLIVALAPACAAWGLKLDGHLDMPALRKAYMESDFRPIRATLEAFLKVHPKDGTREEMIFTHLYLGVICAADSARARAESHFNTLLHLSPHIEPIDMYLPPPIQDLFDRVKHDYLKRLEYETKYDAFGNPLAPRDSGTTVALKDSVAGTQDAKDVKGGAPIGKTGKAPKEKSDHAWVWWTVGGAGLAAAAITTYYVLQDPSPSHKEGSKP